ncbi:MAG: hypothetical protein CMJ69_18725 [Planctomycetaceae bacterium]|nr:hypothetical protein [Planctomycetaceae bacterium]
MKRPSILPRRHNHRRSGFTLVELLVAGVLLASTVVLVGPLLLRSGQLRQSATQRQLATQLASNVLERLDAGQLQSQAVASATKGWDTDTWLPSLKLSTTMDRDGDRRRATISVSWTTPTGRTARPVQLTGWLAPAASEVSP